jgi:8-oxo-dGTP diphosphatase
LRREVREELGVQVRRLSPLCRLSHRYRGREAFFFVFRCDLDGGRPRPLAAQALRWVSARRLRRYRFPPANRPLIARLVG